MNMLVSSSAVAKLVCPTWLKPIPSRASTPKSSRFCAEIQRLNGLATAVREKRVEPFDDRFHDLLAGPGEWKERAAAAFSHSRETGREDAIGELEALFLKADKLFARVMTIPATTKAGRTAKVSTLLVHALGDEWRGSAKELDWEKESTRALLGKFAGMNAGELAAI